MGKVSKNQKRCLNNKILIVDDDKSILETMSKALRKVCNFRGEIKIVKNGEDAVDEISNGSFKIGFLDLSKLFDQYEKTKQIDSILQSEHGAFEKERNAKLEKLRETQGKLALLKEEEKAKVEEEIEKLRTEIIEFDRRNKTDLTKKRDESIREILLEIEKIVSDYAQKENLSLVLNDRVLIYGNKVMDITDSILKVLNENYAKNKK